MFQISVEQDFDAAHFLRGYRGKCEELHGHRFRVVVKVQSSELNDIGLAYDFSDLKRHLRGILERCDHTCLNNIQPFDRINPSSENIAVTIYEALKVELRDASVNLTAVEVWESPQSRVVYSPD